MIAEKIKNTRLVLASLAGGIPEDAWMLLRRALAQLDVAANDVARLESLARVAHGPEVFAEPIRRMPPPHPTTNKPCLRLITPQKTN